MSSFKQILPLGMLEKMIETSSNYPSCLVEHAQETADIFAWITALKRDDAPENELLKAWDFVYNNLEARNYHLASIFVLFNETQQLQHLETVLRVQDESSSKEMDNWFAFFTPATPVSVYVKLLELDKRHDIFLMVCRTAKLYNVLDVLCERLLAIGFLDSAEETMSSLTAAAVDKENAMMRWSVVNNHNRSLDVQYVQAFSPSVQLNLLCYIVNYSEDEQLKDQALNQLLDLLDYLSVKSPDVRLEKLSYYSMVETLISKNKTVGDAFVSWYKDTCEFNKTLLREGTRHYLERELNQKRKEETTHTFTVEQFSKLTVSQLQDLLPDFSLPRPIRNRDELMQVLLDRKDLDGSFLATIRNKSFDHSDKFVTSRMWDANYVRTVIKTAPGLIRVFQPDQLLDLLKGLGTDVAQFSFPERVADSVFSKFGDIEPPEILPMWLVICDSPTNASSSTRKASLMKDTVLKTIADLTATNPVALQLFCELNKNGAVKQFTYGGLRLLLEDMKN